MDNQYRGMTVNERLFISNNLDVFDQAVVEKNVEEIIKILKKVEITDDYTIKQILLELGLID